MLGLRLLSGASWRPLQLVEVTLTLVLLQYGAPGPQLTLGRRLALGGWILALGRPLLATLLRLLLLRPAPGGFSYSLLLILLGLAHDARPGGALYRHHPPAIHGLCGSPVSRLLQ